MKLSEAKTGSWVRIVDFEGEFKNRLVDIGLGRGSVVKVVGKTFFGPLQVEVDGRKIALCRGQAKKIEVEPI
ncbi:MAG: ferrous iron transport protein A [Epsilonproteobacteria bacterium]|nr:ferrous iron transport protein A [Campylobacterota bacterium]